MIKRVLFALFVLAIVAGALAACGEVPPAHVHDQPLLNGKVQLTFTVPYNWDDFDGQRTLAIDFYEPGTYTVSFQLGKDDQASNGKYLPGTQVLIIDSPRVVKISQHDWPTYFTVTVLTDTGVSETSLEITSR